MGCAASSPQDVDTLPIKAHCRTAFSRCSTTDHVNGQASETYATNQTEEGHDVVLCYPLGGTVFGLELQARYEKTDTVSLWTMDHFVSAPGTPVGVSKSMSGGYRGGLGPALEIKPAPEDERACAPTYVALCREVRTCRRGVVVLLTAGCTWDDGVLTCLRLAAKFLRPVVMVHCVQSCPLPALEEWPADIRTLIAAAGPPVKYLAQHSAEALRHVEHRMGQAAEALAFAGAAAGANQDLQQQQQQQQHGVTQQGTPQQQQQQQQKGPTQQQGTWQQQQLEANAQAQVHGAVPPQTPPQMPPSSQQQQPQKQPAAVMSSDCGCLDSELWVQRSPKRQQQQPTAAQNQVQEQQQQQQPVAAAASTAAATSPQTEVSEASPGAASGSPHAGAIPALAPAPDPASLSLAALQASNADICLRASQLLGPWTCSGPLQYGSGGGRGVAATTVASTTSSTPVERLVVSARPSYSSAPMAKGAGVGTSPLPRPLPSKGGIGERSTLGALSRPPQQQQPQGADASGSVLGSGGGARCVLRYHDPGWATPVAFVCAQLEAELGRANVSVQVAASTPAWHLSPSPSPATGTMVRESLQSVDSGRHWSQTWRRSTHQQQAHQQQQQLQQQQQAVTAAVSAAAAAAAAAALRGSQRSSSGSSGRCSPSGGAGTGRAGMSASTSRRTSGGPVNPPIMPRVDDDLETFATLPTDECATPLLAAASVSSSSAQSATAPAVAPPAPPPLMEYQSISWPEVDPGPGGAAAIAAACLVYFMSPGLSAPLGCLAELGAGLASGRRVVLVVDGESCQRLPDYAPAGTTPETWKAVRRVWHERLLYVSDYHSPFCALLKQGIIAAASPP